MSATLQDAINAVNDELGSYSTGITNNDVRVRAINRSVDYAKRNMSIPSDELKQTILFTEDQIYYDVNEDNMESFLVVYSDQRYNRRGNEWEYEDYPHILQSTDNSPRKNKWSITHVNGKKQLVLFGYNKNGSTTLDSLDFIGTWEASDDASGLTTDSVIKYQGAGSLLFDIVKSTGTATVKNENVTYDLQALFDAHGFIKFWAYMTDNNIDAIILRLYQDTGNYFTISVSEADDGSAFDENAWQKIGFSCDDAIITGSPDASLISRVDISFDLGSTFTSAADFRIDSIISVIPDSIDLLYYTSYKGTDATGVTRKKVLNDVTDKFMFSDVDDDILEIIAQRAAIILWPQLRGDKEQYMLLKQEFTSNMKGYTKRWPRKRAVGSFRHILRR